ncbi:MAG: ABC transporter permease subunit [Dehalococcoidia bacterium]|nr:ABC transporter permease subunit [Dehalococcoidia bacterium]
MLKNVFLKTLRDQRRSLLFWGIGLVALALYIALFYPTVRDMPQLSDFFQQSGQKDVFEAFLGGQLPDFSTPTGYLNVELYSLMLPLLMLVFAIGFGSGAIAGEEEKGTLDFLLANPIPRWQVVAEKFGVMVTALLVLSFVFLVGLVIGAVTVDMEISYLRLAQATFSTLLVALDFGMVALFLGCWRGNRGLCIGVSGGLAAVMYFLNSLAEMVDALKGYRIISPFYHHVTPNVLVNGLDPGHTLVLLGIVVVLFVASLPVFDRRDIAV